MSSLGYDETAGTNLAKEPPCSSLQGLSVSILFGRFDVSLERKLQSIVLAVVFLGSAALACGPTPDLVRTLPAGDYHLVVDGLSHEDAGFFELELAASPAEALWS